KRHDVDAARFQHRAGFGQIDLVQLQPVEFFDDAAVGAGQEGGAYAVGLGAEPEVEARGLDLVRIERARRRQRTCVKECSNVAIRQDSRNTHGGTSCLTGEV